MRFAAWFSILAGFGLLLLRALAPAAPGAAPGAGFALAADTLAALALWSGALGLLRRARWGRPAALVGQGMLVYAALTQAGGWAEQRAWLNAGLCLLLLALSGLAIRLVAGGRARPAALHRWAEQQFRDPREP